MNWLHRILTRRFSLVKVNPDKGGIFRQKPKQLRDRFEIHKLTNIDMMCSLVRNNRFGLNLNEFIILLYRMQQVFTILNKSTYYYSEFNALTSRILTMFLDPEDYAW